MITETHHALLFAWIARAVIQRCGRDQGQRAIRKATRRYGEQRGGRMAQRARLNGQPLDMMDFLVYGEWQASDSSKTHSESQEVKPDIHHSIIRCPWNDAWSRAELGEYGCLYCQEIDHALVRGFNPNLQLEVNKTLSNDGEPCEFVYQEAIMEGSDSLSEIELRKSRLRGKTTMPWEYHCGHLYKTFSEVLEEELGEPGCRAVEEAMELFGKSFGGDAARTVLSYKDTDFQDLPA